MDLQVFPAESTHESTSPSFRYKRELVSEVEEGSSSSSLQDALQQQDKHYSEVSTEKEESSPIKCTKRAMSSQARKIGVQPRVQNEMR